MEIEVGEVSRRLGVNDSRVRQMLRAGSLRGRRVGNSWLVLADDVVRMEMTRPRAGRPLAARRAWAALDLLDGGDAPWISDSARSQVRGYLARLDAPDAGRWLSLLRRRSAVIGARAHPAALRRLDDLGGALEAGAVEAARRGFDLVVVGTSVPELYLESIAWPSVARSLAIQESLHPNLLVRLPHEVWPFARGLVSDAALAADLLESTEPRAVAAGAARLDELLARWQLRHHSRHRASSPQRATGSSGPRP